jgi:hypothetical protein
MSYYPRSAPRGLGAQSVSGQLETALISFGISEITTLLTGVIEGCGSSCEVTTQWANQVEAALQQNIAAYFALPIPRSPADQAAALANFQTGWDALVQNCGNTSLGTAGVDCIQDRESGACHWTQPASSVPAWGTPAAGACWNWWNGYHDPIANDPNVAATAPTIAAATASANALTSTSTSGVSLETIGLLAAAALAAWWVLK